MGIFKTITKKLLMCSAKQLGIAAVASLSVMTASFSAIARKLKANGCQKGRQRIRRKSLSAGIL